LTVFAGSAGATNAVGVGDQRNRREILDRIVGQLLIIAGLMVCAADTIRIV
jgi:hypothetical protein